jgi:DNA-binding response OmpR family regulator
MRILIIEDDRDAAQYLAKGLRESGHSAELAEDGRAGLLRAAVEPFDVLIVDRMLPNLDGLSLVQHLRKTGHATPVLFLSALGDVDDRVKGLRAGGDDYLAKPYAFSELLARIENLGRRRNQRSGDRAAAARIPAARDADAACRPGDDQDHAAGAGLELPLRPTDQRDRRPHQPSAPEDRPGVRTAADPHRTRGRLLCP